MPPKEKFAIQEVTTDQQWFLLLGKEIEESNTKSSIGYDQEAKRTISVCDSKF